MNIGQALLREDIREVHALRVAQSMRLRRADYVAVHSDTQTAIVHVLTKCGPMSKNLLFVALPDRLPATISGMVNRMLRRGELVLEERGTVEVIKLAGATQ